MTWNGTARPGDHRTSSTTKWLNVFLANESVVLSVTAGAATTYEVRNYYGTTVGTGAIASGATQIDLGTMPLGWYRIYYIRPSSAGTPWYLSGGEDSFAVVRSASNSLLADRPAAGTGRVESGGDYWTNGLDIPAHAFTGFGHTRSSITYASGYAASLTGAGHDADYFTDWYVNDSARPIHSMGLCSFPDSYGTSDNPTKNTQIGDAVVDLMPRGMTYFECQNEPDSAGVSVNDMILNLQYFSGAVHAGDADAKVLAPSAININERASWFKDVLVGAASYIDVISFHNYTGGSGDLPIQRRTFEQFLVWLQQAGQTSKQRFNSEFGSSFMSVYGSFEPRLQAQATMLELMMGEQYGIPKENTAYFYDQQHGFWDFPSWWINNEGSEPHVGPLMPLLRTYSEELAGKVYTARLDFGTVENNHYVGSRFTDGSTGVGVVAMMSGGRTGNVTLSIGGASPPQSVTVVTAWGGESIVDVVGGLVTVSVGPVPTYVRLPTGNTAAPEAADYGIEVARAQQAVATASSQRADDVQEGIHSVYSPMNALNGRADSSRDGRIAANWPDVYYSSDGNEAMPQWWQCEFPRETRFDTVVVQCPPPWQHSCSLIDFDVQAWNSGTSSWDVVATITEPTSTLQWASSQHNGGCFSDSYYSRNTVFVAQLEAAVSTTKMRIYARQATHGSEAIGEQMTGYGVAGGECGQGSPEKLVLQEVSIFLSGHTDGGNAVAGQKMLVIPAPGA